MTLEVPSAEQRPPLFSRSERVVAWLVGASLAISVLTAIVWQLVFVQILPGQVGVRYSLMSGGTVVDEVLPEGFALKLPWDRVYIYEVRTQRMPFQLTVLSLEGMSLSITGTILYRPVIGAVTELQKDIGPEYRTRLVDPVALSAIRHFAAHYNSHELYSLDFHELRSGVIDDLKNSPSSRYIDYADLLIQSIILPVSVSQSIEQKLAQEQLAASYEFRILSQKQEAERRRIEAIGIQTYYSIISKSINSSLLTWRGIEATVELARSNNTKIVVVGSGKDQMPLILGSDIANTPATPDLLETVTPQQSLRLPDWRILPPMFPGITKQIGPQHTMDMKLPPDAPGGMVVPGGNALPGIGPHEPGPSPIGPGHDTVPGTQ